MRPCAKCKNIFEPKAYQIKHSSYYCPSCASKAVVNSSKLHKEIKYKNNRAYFKRNPHVLYERQIRQREKYPEKYKARNSVQSEIRAGRMKRNPCEKCGNPITEAHHNDYSKPLKVIWLCKKHHDEITMLKARESSQK